MLFRYTSEDYIIPEQDELDRVCRPLWASRLHQQNCVPCVQYRARLLKWYDQNHRKLPWRRNTHSQRSAGGDEGASEDLSTADFAYRVWVSEIMLQQTQVATVVAYFNRWVTRWPNVAALAEASQVRRRLPLYDLAEPYSPSSTNQVPAATSWHHRAAAIAWRGTCRRRSMRSGRGWATTAARATCWRAPGTSWLITEASCHRRWRSCGPSRVTVACTPLSHVACAEPAVRQRG